MTRWLDAIAPEAPTPEQILLRWCVALGRLTRYPHPFRPWVRRRQDEVLEVSVQFARMKRALDTIVADAQTDAETAEAVSRIVREHRNTETN